MYCCLMYYIGDNVATMSVNNDVATMSVNNDVDTMYSSANSVKTSYMCMYKEGMGEVLNSAINQQPIQR